MGPGAWRGVRAPPPTFRYGLPLSLTGARWPGGAAKATSRTRRCSRSRAGRSSCAAACSQAAAASRAAGRAWSSFRTTRSATWSRTSAPAWRLRRFSSNVEKLLEASPRGLPPVRPVRAPAAEGWTWPEDLFEVPAPLKFLVNPNSPTGTHHGRLSVVRAVARARGVVVLDEAYVDFANESQLELVGKFPNLIILRTMSKSYALAGMRIRFALANADFIAALSAGKDSYNLDRLYIFPPVA